MHRFAATQNRWLMCASGLLACRMPIAALYALRGALAVATLAGHGLSQSRILYACRMAKRCQEPLLLTDQRPGLGTIRKFYGVPARWNGATWERADGRGYPGAKR